MENTSNFMWRKWRLFSERSATYSKWDSNPDLSVQAPSVWPTQLLDAYRKWRLKIAQLANSTTVPHATILQKENKEQDNP